MTSGHTRKMSELRLSPRGQLEHTLDLAPLAPAALGALSRAEIPRMQLRCGAAITTLGDWFRVRGATGADTLRIEGGGPCLEAVGAGLTAGTILVEGDVGDLAGAGMQGGRLCITGNAGDYAGAGGADGLVAVGGNAGAHTGGFLPGTAELPSAGMRGATVWVRGNVGAGTGARMRRGLLIVEGRSGPDCAARMQAGTVIALGGCGPRAALGMRRGTLVSGTRLSPPAGFTVCGTLRMQVLRLLFHHVAGLDPRLKFARRLGTLAKRYTGDLSVGGVGEVLALTRVGN